MNRLLAALLDEGVLLGLEEASTGRNGVLWNDLLTEVRCWY